MRWLPDLPAAVRRRLVALWAKTSAGTVHEREVALAALKELQTDHDLDDVALAYLAEREAQEPSRDAVEHPMNLIDQIVTLIEHHRIIVTLPQAITLALWAIHTWAREQFRYSARLLLRSYEPEAGKTVILRFLNELVCEPFLTSNVSPAVLYFQLAEQPHTTFLIDEAEYLKALWSSGSVFRSLFDSGHDRDSGVVARVIGGKVKSFPPQCALALAGVWTKAYPRQMVRRSIIIDCEKHPEQQNDERLDLSVVRAAIAEFAGMFRRPEKISLPEKLRGGEANNWRPLIAIADALGFGATARAVAVVLQQAEVNPVDRVFRDLHRVFEAMGSEALWRDEILSMLHRIEGSHWDEYEGLEGELSPHPLTAADLRRLLRAKRTRMRTVWKRDGNTREDNKGLYRSQLEPVWQAMGIVPTPSAKIVRLPRSKRRSETED
jgi:Protein of unknown function (DUF3631)